MEDFSESLFIYLLTLYGTFTMALFSRTVLFLVYILLGAFTNGVTLSHFLIVGFYLYLYLFTSRPLVYGMDFFCFYLSIIILCMELELFFDLVYEFQCSQQ